METVIDEAGNADPADRVNEVDSSGNGKHTGGDYDDTTPIEARASVVCTPTLPEDEVKRLQGLLAASQERLREVQGDLSACGARERALILGVAAAQAEARAAKAEAAAAVEDFERLQRSVFWPTHEELMGDMRENLHEVGYELAKAREEHAHDLEQEHTEYCRALLDHQHEYSLALERVREHTQKDGNSFLAQCCLDVLHCFLQGLYKDFADMVTAMVQEHAGPEGLARLDQLFRLVGATGFLDGLRRMESFINGVSINGFKVTGRTRESLFRTLIVALLNDPAKPGDLPHDVLAPLLETMEVLAYLNHLLRDSYPHEDTMTYIQDTLLPILSLNATLLGEYQPSNFERLAKWHSLFHSVEYLKKYGALLNRSTSVFEAGNKALTEAGRHTNSRWYQKLTAAWVNVKSFIFHQGSRLLGLPTEVAPASTPPPPFSQHIHRTTPLTEAHFLAWGANADALTTKGGHTKDCRGVEDAYLDEYDPRDDTYLLDAKGVTQVSLRRAPYGQYTVKANIRPGDWVTWTSKDILVKVDYIITTPSLPLDDLDVEHCGDPVWIFGTKWARDGRVAPSQRFSLHHLYRPTKEKVGGLLSCVFQKALTWPVPWLRRKAQARIFAPDLERDCY